MTIPSVSGSLLSGKRKLLNCTVSPSGHNQTAIDIEGLASNIAGAGAGEKHSHGGDILGIVGTPDGDSFEAAPFHLFDGHAKRLSALYHGGLRHRRACDPRANGVDVDVIAPQLMGSDHSHGNDGPFTGGVGGVGSTGIALPGDRGDVYNPSPLALRNHLLRRPLHAEKYAFGVHPMDTVPVRLCDLHDVQ